SWRGSPPRWSACRSRRGSSRLMRERVAHSVAIDHPEGTDQDRYPRTMISRLPSIGVVLAGGVGRRVGHSEPKQLIKLAGRTILGYTIAPFDAAPAVDEVVVRSTPGFAEPVRELVRRRGFGKVTAVVEGGATRTESTWRALRAVGDRECNVLLHDAVRPLLEPRIIADCVRALETCEAVEVAIPSSDTVLVA